MREVTRRRWRLVLDVLLWLMLSAVVSADASNNPNRWELIAGLVAVAMAVAASRRSARPPPSSPRSASSNLEA
jgi:hypothetical protein